MGTWGARASSRIQTAASWKDFKEKGAVGAVKDAVADAGYLAAYVLDLPRGSDLRKLPSPVTFLFLEGAVLGVQNTRVSQA